MVYSFRKTDVGFGDYGTHDSCAVDRDISVYYLPIIEQIFKVRRNVSLYVKGGQVIAAYCKLETFRIDI